MESSTAPPEQITLDEAARLAACNPKTIRRAVARGRLPCQYVSSARGPRLVFQPEDVEHWIQGRRGRHQGRHGRPQQPEGTSSAVGQQADMERLRHTIGENERKITALLNRLTTQLGALSELQASTAALTQRLADRQAGQDALSSVSGADREQL